MKHLLLIHPDGNLQNNPTLNSLTKLLLANDWHVNILYKQHKGTPDISFKGVKCIADTGLFFKIKRFFIKFILFFYWHYNFDKFSKYTLIIGIDREGIIEASVYSELTKIPYSMVSFEIFFQSETSEKFKRPEIIACQKLLFCIFQDSIRSKYLQTENHIAEHTIYLLPLASDHACAVNSTARLRDDLGITKDKKVVIAIGSIKRWTMIDVLLKSLPMWPDNWVLIIHHRYGDTHDCIVRFNMQQDISESHRLFISNVAPLDIDDLSYVLSGVDFGFAMYRPTYDSIYTGLNLKYIGLSSGKISTYLRFGVPLLIND